MEEESVGELEDLFIRNLKKAMFALLSWFLHNPRGGEVVCLKQSRRCCSVLASDCRLSWAPWQEEDHCYPWFCLLSSSETAEIEICVYTNMYNFSLWIPFLQNAHIPFLSDCCYTGSGVIHTAGSKDFILCRLNFFTPVALKPFVVVSGTQSWST